MILSDCYVLTHTSSSDRRVALGKNGALGEAHNSKQNKNTRNVSVQLHTSLLHTSFHLFSSNSLHCVEILSIVMGCCVCTINILLDSFVTTKKYTIKISQCGELNLIANMFPHFSLFPSDQLASRISQSLAISLSHSNDIRTKYFLSPIRVLAPCRAL